RIAGARIVVPTAMGLQVHGTEFPAPHRILDPLLEPPVLFLFANFKPVLNKKDTVVSKERFEARAHTQEQFVLFVAAKAHDMFDESAVVPAAVKNSDLAGGR